MRLYVVEVGEQTLDKIEGKHGITIDEIIEVCQSKRTTLRRGREGLHKGVRTYQRRQVHSGRTQITLQRRRVVGSHGPGHDPVRAPHVRAKVRRMMARKIKHWEDEQHREIERIDSGGNAWLDTDEIVELDIKQPLDKIVPVRLTSDKWAALRREAIELGIGPTTLARMWILEKLRSVTAGRAAPKPPSKRRRSA